MRQTCHPQSGHQCRTGLERKKGGNCCYRWYMPTHKTAWWMRNLQRSSRSRQFAPDLPWSSQRSTPPEAMVNNATRELIYLYIHGVEDVNHVLVGWLLHSIPGEEVRSTTTAATPVPRQAHVEGQTTSIDLGVLHVLQKLNLLDWVLAFDLSKKLVVDRNAIKIFARTVGIVVHDLRLV